MNYLDALNIAYSMAVTDDRKTPRSIAVIISSDGELVSIGKDTWDKHAEANAVFSAIENKNKKEQLCGATLVVVRVKNNAFKDATPCGDCLDCIRCAGIKDVYHSGEDGDIYKITL